MVLSNVQNTVALQQNVFLIEIHRILVTNKGLTPLSIANNFQGQLKTLQLIPVVRKVGVGFRL